MPRYSVAKIFMALTLGALASAVSVEPVGAGLQCKGGHWHYGSSSKAHKSKKAALRDAIGSWAGFTDFEYGSAWAFFKLAADKRTKCERQPGNLWTCNVEGRPCKRTRRR